MENIKTITKQISEVSGLPILQEPSSVDYHCFNDGGVELEVGEFLYGLTRMMRPQSVVETGTHKGISSSYIALALEENQKGNLDTFEITPQHWQEAEKLWRRLEITDKITLHQVDVATYSPKQDIDIFLSDTEPGLRFAEVIKFYPFVKPGGIILIHDLHRHLSQEPHPMFFGWPFGELPEQLKNWIKDGDLKVMSFSTPRGLTLLYKPHPNDYKPR